MVKEKQHTDLFGNINKIMDNEEKQFFIEMARSDLLSFCVYSDKFFEIAPHHEIIANALHKVLTGETKNLMICMPPRA
jgi:hypothetical protein